MRLCHALAVVACSCFLTFIMIAACSGSDPTGHCDECPEGQACNPAGVCAVICDGHVDCDPCQDCVDGFCAPGEYLCAECSLDDRCDGGLLCVDGQCVRCEPGVDDEPCAEAHGGDIYRCNPDGTCGLPPCDEHSDCHEWGRVCVSNYCWPCEAGPECEAAGYPDHFECLDGQCVEAQCEESVAPADASADPAVICTGSSTLSVIGGDLGAGASWFWYSDSCGGMPEGTGSQIEVSPAFTTTYYVRAEGECNITSCAETTVTVAEESHAGVISASHAEVCHGGSSVLTVSGHIGEVQWQSSPDNSTWLDMEGATEASYTATNIVTSSYYRAEVTSGNCAAAHTSSVLVSIKSESTTPTSAMASPTNICEGGQSELSVTGGSLGAGASWRWYAGSCGAGPEVGAGPTITVSPNETTEYFVRAVGDCNSTSCESIHVYVSAPSVAGTVNASPSNICAGQASTLTVASHNGDLQWQSSLDDETWHDIVGATTPSYTDTGITNTTYYRVRAQSGQCEAAYADSIQVTVKTSSSDPTGANASPESICAGEESTLTVSGGDLGVGAS